MNKEDHTKKDYCDTCPEYSTDLKDGMCIQCYKKYHKMTVEQTRAFAEFTYTEFEEIYA